MFNFKWHREKTTTTYSKLLLIVIIVNRYKRNFTKLRYILRTVVKDIFKIEAIEELVQLFPLKDNVTKVYILNGSF